MNILRQLSKLFSGGPRLSGDDIGLYHYVRCKRCGEVIRVRINPMNDLSADDQNKNRFVHKVIVGQRCYNRIEADFTYNTNRQLIDSSVSGGTLVDEAAYQADQRSAAVQKS